MDAMKALRFEHEVILKVLACLEHLAERAGKTGTLDEKAAGQVLDFIRVFADSCHHAKEEDILFKYFDESTDILRVMHEDHKVARSHVQSMLEALDKQDEATLARHLNAYGDLLTEHIRKEDEILYPWMDKNLSMRQIGELFSKFDEVDRQINFSPVKYEAFINELEEKF